MLALYVFRKMALFETWILHRGKINNQVTKIDICNITFVIRTQVNLAAFEFEKVILRMQFLVPVF